MVNHFGTFPDSQFIFYKSYHNNFVNECIHIVFVWPIFISALVLLLHSPNLGTVMDMDVNVALLVTIYYASVYAIIELPGFAGFLASAMACGSYLLAQHIKETLHEQAWAIGLAAHITSWVAQFYGHGVHEGRSPALLSNLYQALVMAPLFVVMEVLFNFGYRPNFRIKCQRHVDKVSTGAQSGPLTIHLLTLSLTAPICSAMSVQSQRCKHVHILEHRAVRQNRE